MSIGRSNSERDPDMWMQTKRRDLLYKLDCSTGDELREAIQQGKIWVSKYPHDGEVAKSLEHATARSGF